MSLSRADIVGVLPDGKHAVVKTKRKAEAFIAICEECGMSFDNDIAGITLAQGVALHRRGAGHMGLTYYALELLSRLR